MIVNGIPDGKKTHTKPKMVKIKTRLLKSKVSWVRRRDPLGFSDEKKDR